MEKEGGEEGEDTTAMLWDAVVDLQNRVKKLEHKSISEPENEKEENVNNVKR